MISGESLAAERQYPLARPPRSGTAQGRPGRRPSRDPWFRLRRAVRDESDHAMELFRRMLDQLKTRMAAHNRAITAVLRLVIGAKLLGDGIAAF